jgi:hypothetical protein
MCREVWKFLMPHWGLASVSIPDNWRLCHIGIQNGVPWLWAEVEPSAPRRKSQFVSYQTGEEIADGDLYLGTAVFGDKNYVCHVYYRRELNGQECKSGSAEEQAVPSGS